MKKRVVIGLAAVPFLLLGGALSAVVVVPMLYKDKVMAMVMDQAQAQVDADVSVGDGDLTMIRSFPDLTLTVDDVAVVNHAPFEGVELFTARSVQVTVDLMSAISGNQLEIERLALDGPSIHLVFDEQGRSNMDIEKTAEVEDVQEATEPSLTTLSDYEITDLSLLMEDRAADFVFRVTDLDQEGSADLSDAGMSMATHTDIAAMTVTDGGVDLMRELPLVADLDMDIDFDREKYTFRKSRIQVGQVATTLDGFIAYVGDDMDLDLQFEAEQTTFAALLSLVPAASRADMQGLDAKGSVTLSGVIKGILPAEGDDLPSFDLELSVGDGSFRYTDLPAGVDGVNVDMKLSHPGGNPDLVVIDVQKLSLKVDGQPLSGRVKLSHPMTDPDITAQLVGKVDLDVLKSALPASQAKFGGKLDVDVDLAGRISAFEAQNLDAVRAEGRLALAGFVYDDPEVGAPVYIDKMSATLSPVRADISTLNMRIGESDMALSGSVDNMLSYVLSDATLVGRFRMSSHYLDLDAFATEDEAEGADKGKKGEETGLIVVPSNLDLDLTSSMDKVTIDGKTLEDVQGRLVVAGGAVKMEHLDMKFLGGRLVLGGSYQAPSAESADVVFKVEMVEFDLEKTFEAVETLRRLAPLAEGASGRFDTDIRVESSLGPDYAPNLATMLSSGRIQTKGLTLKPKFMGLVADQLGNPRYAGIDVPDTDISFDLKNGHMTIKPVNVKIGGTTARLSGTTGVDSSLDLALALKIPVRDVKAAALAKLLPGGDEVDITVAIGGTAADPKVKVSVGDLVAETLGDVRDQAADRLDDATDRLIEEARAQGDKLVAEAQRAADQVREKAKLAADKLRDEAREAAKKLKKAAKGNAIKEAAADKAAQKLIDEADKKASKLEKEADKKADLLVEAAEKQRDDLIDKAEAKAAQGSSAARGK